MMTFQFISDTGSYCVIVAKSKGEAVKKFCKDSHIPEDFVKDHYRIVNLGRDKS